MDNQSLTLVFLNITQRFCMAGFVSIQLEIFGFEMSSFLIIVRSYS